MCMGGGGDGGAGAARVQERQRTALARSWTDYVTAAFEGGTVPLYNGVVGQTAQAGGMYDRLTKQGKFQPVAFKPGQTLGKNIYSLSMQKLPGYGGMYDQIKNDYANYAMPQYQSQLGETQRGLVGNMAQRGLLGSSIAQNAADALSSQATLAKQGIVDQGQAYANQVKQQMAQQEALLKSQVLASSDPASAAAGALQTAGAFSTPPAFAPLGSLFNTFANSYLLSQVGQQTPSYYMPYGYQPQGGSNAWMPNNTK